jgi:hypothetical protein
VNAKSTHPHPSVPAWTANAVALKALALFFEAHEYARQAQQTDWEFSVELPALLEAGCSRSVLRWLASKGYVEHALERTRPQAGRRSFRRTANLSFAARSCFVLTPSGLAVARQFDQAHDAVAGPHLNGIAYVDPGSNGYPLPHWDQALRELRLGATLIKAYTQPSPNQETILAVFQEEGWPARIDSPLSPPLHEDGKRRLHDTITRLNRHQQHRLIRFRSDSNGEGVRWAIVTKATPEPHQSDACS